MKAKNTPHLRITICLSLFFSLISCGDSSSTITGEINPAGRWLLTFNELIDECDVIAPDSEGTLFESEQLVEETAGGFSISSSELVFGDIEAIQRSERSLIAEDEVSGDLFGTGAICTLSERLAYNDITESTARVVYEVVIDCGGEERCDSLFRASATKF